MVKNQRCKPCKLYFADNSPQKNYTLYATYGFANEEQFRNHNSKNKCCPFKLTTNNAQLVQEPDENEPVQMDNNIMTMDMNVDMNIPEVEWGPYISNISLSQEDYADNQEILKLRLKKHCRGGFPLWFENSEIAAYSIVEQLLNPNTQFITLVAEPGAGKTAVMHCLTSIILMLPYEVAINHNCITFTTGMSDTDWFNQLMNNFKLRDDTFILESLYGVKDNYCVAHRSTFHKRITWLLNNLEYISNSIFIIDEHHFADDIEMTLDNEFKRFGLTEEKMREYNIKIIYVSATPDVSLSIISNHDNHKMVVLKNGENYKGFEYYTNENMLMDYTNDILLDNLIRKNYSTPRYNYIRARTQQEKGLYRETIITTCKKNDWIIIEDDSDNNYYLSFKQDENERIAEIYGKSIIRTYLNPLKHTIILIKSKYPASKRLKITKYTGVVMEKPAGQMSTTITCNGLVPRFWGYDELPEFPHNQKPIFVCNKKCVDEYIKFKQDFVYNGKSYTSNRIKSDENKLRELKNTWCGKLAGAEPTSYDTSIAITNGKNGEPNYFNSVDEIAVFLRSCGFTNVRDVNEFVKGPNGYVFPRRNQEHNSEETRLIKNDYEKKFVKNGGGTNINRKWNTGVLGQPYMIWPVYETIDSPPESVKYYVHYLKLNSENETSEEI